MDAIVSGSRPLRASKHNEIRACPQENAPFKSDVNSSSELFYYRSQVDLGPIVCKTPLRDLTVMTLADEDTNSIQTDNAKLGKPGQCGNASGATWWPTL